MRLARQRRVGIVRGGGLRPNRVFPSRPGAERGTHDCADWLGRRIAEGDQRVDRGDDLGAWRRLHHVTTAGIEGGDTATMRRMRTSPLKAGE
jgi:hypothetical protein